MLEYLIELLKDEPETEKEIKLILKKLEGIEKTINKKQEKNKKLLELIQTKEQLMLNMFAIQEGLRKVSIEIEVIKNG